MFEHVSKNFGNTVAVNDVSFTVPDRGFACVVGPSGCGKTTLLRCLAGLETPDSGKMFIDSQLANELPPRDRDIAMVFQNYALFPHMSVYGNIAFPLKVRGTPDSEVGRRVNEVAVLLGIQRTLEKSPRQLSGGEQQRVALGRALVRGPRAFLMDEPLSNLDAPLRAQMRTELKRIHKEFGITTLYVTHDQAEAMALADMVGVMNKGVLLQYDTPQNVYLKPTSSFVAGFLGNPPANLVEVRLSDSAGSSLLQRPGFSYEIPTSMASLLRQEGASGEFRLAIRPEDVRISTDRASTKSMQAEVSLTEPLGSSTVLDLKVGETHLKALAPGDFAAESGMRLWIEFNADRIHVFDGRTDALLI